jgi:hypothetical protein
MQTTKAARGFRQRLIATAAIGALALSMLPMASAAAADIDPWVATQVNIINLPPSAVAGQSFGFQVEAVNAFGNRDWDYGGPMALLSVTSTPPCAIIGIIFTNGLATVSSMSCGTVGSTTIGADTADLSPDFATINITSDRVLQFSSYPSATTPSLLSPQPTVQLRNGSGGLITNPLNQATVTLTVSPAVASFTCSGGTTLSTVGGIASFTGCTLPAGTNYQLTASAAFGSPSPSSRAAPTPSRARRSRPSRSSRSRMPQATPRPRRTTAPSRCRSRRGPARPALPSRAPAATRATW